MTLSNAELLANKTLALQLIEQYCGNAAIGSEYEKDSPHFEPILDTTWESLAADGCVSLSTWHFGLKSRGWIAVLGATGKLCGEQMQKDLGRLCAALKNRLEGRKEAALVSTDEIVNKTGLPHFWVVNAIHARLIELCFKRKGAYWAAGDEMESLIEVPMDFDHWL